MIPVALPDHHLHVSAFDNAYDNQPKGRTTTLSAFVRALTTFPVIAVANKLDLPAWSPARFPAATERRSRNVIDVHALVFDHDDGDPDAALAGWAGCIAVVHSTWSHTERAPRFRVVVPLARPIPASRWRAALELAAARAPGADPACKDPARLYFRPARRSFSAAHFAKVQGGQLLDLLLLLPPPALPPARAFAATLPVPYRLRDRATDVRLAHDPASRERIAAEIGADLAGAGLDRRAVHAPCPACGDRSVWFYLSPSRLRRARCNHRNTCGWSGALDELLLLGAA
ncbi:MAG: hypothetical protein ACOZNI_10555 [Myxococcota bacterium]